MSDRRFGRVVNISSFVGQAGNFGQCNYSASKGGVIAFTKSAAIELAKHNITVNAIAPGLVFLCAEGDYITGQQINVNGGVYM
jgi:NAD(P)-dependent dehydrogenase (short-subunit alcohol dehydrogenase family)